VVRKAKKSSTAFIGSAGGDEDVELVRARIEVVKARSTII
jgi:hypothetical protein